MITNSGATSNTVYPQFVTAVRISKQQLTSSFTAQSSLRKENPLSQDESSGTISRQSDSTITKVLLFDDSLKQFFTDVNNRVYFINREIQLPKRFLFYYLWSMFVCTLLFYVLFIHTHIYIYIYINCSRLMDLNLTHETL